jgi:glutamate-ammonia-ligase adenylyltransferase
MGSFGSKELTFASDVDLIFVVSDIQNYEGIQKDFQNLLQIFKDNLPGIEIDCRLRPEGKTSQLVWDIEDYKKYFSNRARIWELQSFTKCRFVSGNADLFNSFYTHYIQTVSGKDSTTIKKEMFEMRKKLYPAIDALFNIKKSSGGLADIDFIVSFYLLTNPDLLIVRNEKGIYNSFELIQKVSTKEIIFNQLEENYYLLKKIELVNQLIFNNRLSKIPAEETKIKKLAKELGFSNSELFLNKLSSIIEQTRKQYQKIFN